MLNKDYLVSNKKSPYSNAKILLESLKDQIMTTTNQDKNFPLANVEAFKPEDQQLKNIYTLYNEIINQLKSPKKSNIMTQKTSEGEKVDPPPSQKITKNISESSSTDFSEIFAILKKTASYPENKDIIHQVSECRLSSTDKRKFQQVVKAIKQKLDSLNLFCQALSSLAAFTYNEKRRYDIQRQLDGQSANMFRSLSQMRKAVDQSMDELRKAKCIPLKLNQKCPTYWTQYLTFPISDLIKVKKEPIRDNLEPSPSFRRTTSDNNSISVEIQQKLKQAQAQLEILNKKSKEIYQLCEKELSKCQSKLKYSQDLKAAKTENQATCCLQMMEQMIQQDFSQLFDFFIAVYEERGSKDLMEELKKYKQTKVLEKAESVILLEETNKQSQRVIQSANSKNKQLQSSLLALKSQFQSERKTLQSLQLTQIERTNKLHSEEIMKKEEQIALLKQAIKSKTECEQSNADRDIRQRAKSQNRQNTQEQRNQQKHQLQVLKEQIVQQRAQIDSIKHQKTILTNHHAHIVSQKQKKILEQEQETKGLKSNLVQLECTLSQKLEQIDQLKQKINNLMQENNALQRFKAENEKTNSEIKKIYESAASDQTTKINAMEGTNHQNLIQIQRLEEEIRKLKEDTTVANDNESKVHQDQIKVLYLQIAELNNQLFGLRVENERLSTDLAKSNQSLSRQIDRANQQLLRQLNIKTQLQTQKNVQLTLANDARVKEQHFLIRIQELKRQKESDQVQIVRIMRELEQIRARQIQNLQRSEDIQKQRQEQAKSIQNASNYRQHQLLTQISEKYHQIKIISEELEHSSRTNNTLCIDFNQITTKHDRLMRDLNIMQLQKDKISQEKQQIINDHRLLQESKINISKQLSSSKFEIQKLSNQLHTLTSKYSEILTEIQYLKVQREDLLQKYIQKQKDFDRISSQLNQCRANVQQLFIQNQQLSRKEHSHSSKLGNRYLTLSKLHEIDLEEVAQIDKAFDFDILYDHFEHKKNLIKHIETLKKEELAKSKLLYRFDPLNITSFHKYIDNKSNLLCLVKTNRNAFIACFYQGEYAKGEPMIKPALLISLNNNLAFKLYNSVTNTSGRNFRGMTYDDFFLIFGNAELRIRANEKVMFSNFGIGNSFFNNRGHRVNDLLMEGDNREVEIESYEIYELTFENGPKNEY